MIELVPVTQRETRAFVQQHHRHSKPDRGDIFRVGVAVDGELVAVASAGRPKAATFDDGRTLEITRVCSSGYMNACSAAYAALCRAGAALGFTRVYTYTLEREPGSSLLAAGFVLDAVLPERDWAAESGYDRYEGNLFGERQTPAGRKVRWRRDLKRRRLRSRQESLVS